MYDSGKIIIGIVVFLIVATLPVVYNAASGQTDEPVLQKVVGETDCVQSLEYMQAYHMDLLNMWRDEVVRDGEREFYSHTGRKFDKSLTNTCLKCHTSKENFCDKCHLYADVTPDCWDCHINPEDL